MQCLECQHESPKHPKFCLECDDWLALTCARSRAQLPWSAQSGLGAMFRRSSVSSGLSSILYAEAPRREKPHPLGCPRGRARAVTVLFADVKDSIELLA